MPTGTKLNID